MKMMMIAAMLVATLSANAQNEIGKITLKPMVGINLSTITDEKDSKMKIGLVAGAEAEYGLTEKLGISAGLLYSMQAANLTVTMTKKNLTISTSPLWQTIT